MNRGRSGIGGRAASDGSNAYRYDYEFEPDVGIFLDRFPGKSHLQFLKKMSCKKSEGEAELR